MTTRSRQIWKADSKGYFTRQIGWKQSSGGKLTQHKFILGTDLREARRREAKLLELWQDFEATQSEQRPLWPEGLLQIAKVVARGVAEVVVQRKPDEMQFTFADRIRRMQLKYPVVCFVPSDQYAYEVGREALAVFDSMPGLPEDFAVSSRATDADVMQTWIQARSQLERVGMGLSDADAEALHTRPPRQSASVANGRQPSDALPAHTARAETSSPARGIGAPKPTSSASLHQAMKAYQRYLEKEYYRPEIDELSAWGHAQVRLVKRLMYHHPNMLLSRLDLSAVDELFGYWRRRPFRKGTKRPITAKSASNFISALHRFLRWLSKDSSFDWRKPVDFDEIDIRVRTLPSDHARKKLDQVDTFSLDELTLLVKYGQPFERLLILLALNCGFGRAEISSLLVGEVYLRTPHDPIHQEVIQYRSTENDSFIKRVRRKSGVYGEHILFPVTVQGIEWAIERRKQFPNFSSDARLLVNGNGKPLDQPTKNGNANQIIANHFDRLIKRIQDDGASIRKLSFNKLRKTASQLIRNHSDGEVMAVFDCHGKPVKGDALSDVYSNRPFGKVFEAIRKVEAYLSPVFQAAGGTPFAS